MNSSGKRKASDDGDGNSQQKRGRDDIHVDNLEQTLLTLPALLKKRQEDLDKREKALELAEQNFAKESGNAYGNEGDVLSLNIGGTVVTVFRRTLCQGGQSMLASRFFGAMG